MDQQRSRTDIPEFACFLCFKTACEIEVMVGWKNLATSDLNIA